MDADDTLVTYKIFCNTANKSVRLDVSGFHTSEDAMAFADWLAQTQLDDCTPEVLH